MVKLMLLSLQHEYSRLLTQTHMHTYSKDQCMLYAYVAKVRRVEGVKAAPASEVYVIVHLTIIIHTQS